MKDLKYLSEDMEDAFNANIIKSATDFLNETFPKDVQLEIEQEIGEGKGYFDLSTTDNIAGGTFIVPMPKGFSENLRKKIEHYLKKEAN